MQRENDRDCEEEQSVDRLTQRIPPNEFTLYMRPGALMKINSVIFYLDNPIPRNWFSHFLSVPLRLFNQGVDPGSTLVRRL